MATASEMSGGGMRARRFGRWLLLFGAAVMVAVCVMAVSRTRAVGDTACGPVWSPQYRDPCMAFHYERGAVAVGSAAGAAVLVVVARRRWD